MNDAKYAIIIAGGAADAPVESLSNRTPLEAAATPHLDSIAADGRLGTVRNVPAGMTAGSDVAALSLLGYDPAEYYTGRAPIEAVARNLRLGPDDVPFRCNLVTIVDGEMVDHAGGGIRSTEAAELIAALNTEFAADGVRFVEGISYRHLMVVPDASVLDIACIPPHAIHGEPAADYHPKGSGARRLGEIIRRANEVVSSHDVNLVRRDLGETPANAVWPWGQGVTPIMRRFRHRFGLRGAMVAGTDLMRGLAKLLGLTWIDVPGATGTLDTDYAAKGRAAAGALDEHDLVVVHVEAPGEAGLAGDADAKTAAIERIDAQIVGPLIERLAPHERRRILAAVDIAAPVAARTITDAPAPFCLAGPGVSAGIGPPRFDERAAAASDFRIDRGSDLLEFVLRR